VSDILTSLTALAVSVFRKRSDRSYDAPRWLEPRWTADPVLLEAQKFSVVIPERHPEIDTTVRQMFSEPDLSSLAPREGELDPMLLTPSGGFRMSSRHLLISLLSSAFLRIYYLRLSPDEGTFVRSVLEGFDELRRAARGEPIRAHSILGIAGVALPEGKQVSTPWGVLRPAPPALPESTFVLGWHRPNTTCLLAEARLIRARFDRGAQPASQFDPSDVPAQLSPVLFPLACALASRESADPAVPLITWSTVLLPFQGGFSYSQPALAIPFVKPAVDITDRIDNLEEWTRIIDAAHVPAVDIAARRLVSASAQRFDQSDALIDAVMVWENLVGTSTETTFRVTAALAKALEPDRTKRRSFRQSLKKVYDVRSKVVHGVAVEQPAVNDAASQAVSIAIQAMRSCYKRGRSWLELSSTERADSLLLEDP
jgi:hypothetical protein